MSNTKKENIIMSKKVKFPFFYEMLAEKRVITLWGVGTFEVIVKKPYLMYIPSTGEKRMHDGRVRIIFRPARALKAFIKNHVEQTRKSNVEN